MESITGLALVSILVKVTLLVAAASGVLLVARRLPAATRHLVGLLALVGALLVPIAAWLVPSIQVPLFAAPASARNRVAPAAQAPLAPVPQVERGTPRTKERASPVLAMPSQEARVRSVEPASPASRPEPVRVPVTTLLVAAWALGALVVLARSAAGIVRVRGIIRRATPVHDTEWLERTAELSRQLGLARPPRLFHTKEVGVALTASLLEPAILLPDEARTWPEERRRLVLLHELAHVARRDGLVLFVSALASAVYWFHPLVWFLVEQIRHERERAADDVVLAAGARPSDYAAELLSIVRALRVGDGGLPVMAVVEGTRLESRVRSILDPALPRRGPSTVAVRLGFVALVCAAVGVGAVVPWSVATASPSLTHARPRRAAPAFESPDLVPVDTSAAPDSAPARLAGLHLQQSLRKLASYGKSVMFANKRSPKTGSDFYERGMSFHNAGRYTDAREAFLKSIDAGYREDAASYNIACGWALAGETDRAFEWLRRAVDAGFDVASYVEHDDDLDSLRDDPRFQALRKEARDEKKNRNSKETSSLKERLAKLVARAPKDGSGFYQLGSDLLRADEYEAAVQAFQAAADRGNREGASLYNIACAHALAGDRARALDALARSLEAGYDDPANIDKDDDLDSIRDDPRFAELRKTAKDLSLPGGGNWSFGSFNLDARPLWKKAATRTREYISAHPGSGRAYFNLGFVSLKLDDPKAAREAFQEALRLGFRKSTTMYNLACSHARLDEKDAAFEWLFRSIDAGFDAKGTLRSDDDLDNLRGDPRFRKALRLVESRDRSED